MHIVFVPLIIDIGRIYDSNTFNIMKNNHYDLNKNLSFIITLNGYDFINMKLVSQYYTE